MVPDQTKVVVLNGGVQYLSEARGKVVVEALRYKTEGRGSRPDEVTEFYQFTSSFRPH
jgi:hypothetical protein